MTSAKTSGAPQVQGPGIRSIVPGTRSVQPLSGSCDNSKWPHFVHRSPFHPSPSIMEDMLPVKIAVLDDYQGVALSTADWSPLDGRAEITVFRDHVGEPDAVVARLEPFDVVCVMRERTPLPRAVLERLPRLV